MVPDEDEAEAAKPIIAACRLPQHLVYLPERSAADHAHLIDNDLMPAGCKHQVDVNGPGAMGGSSLRSSSSGAHNEFP